MKKGLSLLLSLIMVFGVMTSMPLTVNAANGWLLTFTLNDDGKSYSLTAGSYLGNWHLDIPGSYKNLPVTSIGDYAFKDCEYLESVTIPDSVTNIGNAFYNCENLEIVTLPNSVTSISSGAFYKTGYYNDSSNWENNVLYIGKHLIGVDESISGSYKIKAGTKTIAIGAFAWCSSLTSITIPNSVTSISGNTFLSCSSLTSVTIPDSVTNIDWDAFNGCTNLISITIPKSVKTIEDGAFGSCTSLKSIKVAENNTKYVSVDGILFNKDKTTLVQYPAGKTDIKYSIPNSVMSISGGAFSGCSNLTSITIPDSVTSIGDGAFDDCIGLTSITIPDSVTSIGSFAFAYCDNLVSITIPQSVTSIGAYAFCDCDGLTTITIPHSVKKIEEDAFDGCKNLSSVYITDIGSWCNIDFYNYKSNPLCYADTIYLNGKLINNAVVIPEGATKIPTNTFKNCTGLTSVTIPDSVTSIEDSAFYGCTNLTSITISDSITSIGDYAFDNTGYYNDINNWNNGVLYIGNHFIKADTSISGNYTIKAGTKTIANWAFEDCKNLVSITIPDSLVGIGTGAFRECTNLISITIPDSVTSIGGSAFWCCSSLIVANIGGNVSKIPNGAFKACKNLKTINLGEGITAIEDEAFCGCSGLTSITIPEGVTSIGEGAFYGCENLTSVVIPDSVTNLGEEAFFDCENLTAIKLPANISDIGEYALGYYQIGNMSCSRKISGFTIYGIDGTAAEAYAVKNGFAFESTCTHTSTKWVTDKKASVNSKGEKHKECTVCGKVLETTTIAQLKCSKPKISKISNTSSGVKISWSKVSGADTYRVYRKTKNGDWKYLGSTSKTSYTDKTAKSGTKYYYAVRARNEAGNSSLSSSLSKYYLADPTLKTPKSTKSGVSLKWTKTAGAQGYIIYRQTGSGSYKKLKIEKGVSNLSYVDKSAKKGKKYTYKVKAYYSKTYSAYSNTKTITDKY